MRQTIAGATTDFLYDGDRLIAEYNGATLLKRYAHGPGVDEPIVWYEGATLTTKRWLHPDERGSIVAWTDASAVATVYRYGAFGEPANNDFSGSRFRYTGQIALPEVRLYHYKARVYDPNLGRFLQTDPVGYKDDYNLYAYVSNDPLNSTDPSGQEGVGCWNNGKGCGGEIGVAARTAYVGVKSEQVRAGYNERTSKLDASDSAGRSAVKADARANTPTEVRTAVEAKQPGLGAKEGSEGTANRPSAAANQTAKTLGTVGKGAVVVTLTLGAVEIATSDNPGRSAAGVAGATAGGVAGGKGGAVVGALIGAALGGPPGAAIGAVVGGAGGAYAGGTLGHEAGTGIYNAIEEN